MVAFNYLSSERYAMSNRTDERIERLKSAYDWATGANYPGDIRASEKTNCLSYVISDFSSADLKSLNRAKFKLLEVYPERWNSIRIIVSDIKERD